MKRLTTILVLCIFMVAGVQSAMATVHTLDPSDGGAAILTYGTWGGTNGQTFTFYENVSLPLDDTIVITLSNLTLDGNGCTIKGSNSGNGIRLHGVTGVTIREVTVSDFNYGVHISGGSGNFVFDNILSGNVDQSEDEGRGIYLQATSSNTIRGNTIEYNYNGIVFHGSAGNNIFNNNFLDNHRPAYYFSPVLNNFYEEPQVGGGGGGNYWSDWTPSDELPKDGIADVQYDVLDQGGNPRGVDLYPWVAQDAWLNQWPVADVGGDQSVNTDDTVTLDGSDSTDADGDSLTYDWFFISFPSDNPPTLSPVQGEPAKRTFVVDVPGDYVAQLIVNDGIADSEPDSVTISVGTNNSAPVADAGDDQSVCIGDTVTLNGSGSTDDDLDPLTYEWSLTRPEGSAAELDDPASENPEFVGDVPGDYVAQLVVNDDTVDSAPDEITIEVLGPQDIKNGAIDLLEKAKTGDWWIDKYLNEAIRYIKRSLRNALWEDEMHLNPRHGKRVFDYEKWAVYKLKRLLKCGNLDSGLATTCQTVIDNLWAVDEMLAMTAFNEAKLACEGSDDAKIARELAKCADELDKASKELNKGHEHHAINHFKKVWEHAQRALKRCGQ